MLTLVDLTKTNSEMSWAPHQTMIKDHVRSPEQGKPTGAGKEPNCQNQWNKNKANIASKLMCPR